VTIKNKSTIVKKGILITKLSKLFPRLSNCSALFRSNYKYVSV